MRRIASACVLLAVLATPLSARAQDDAARARRWHDVAAAVFDGREPVALPGWVSIDAPPRAMDAALVPITLTLAPDKPIRAVYLIVDENPSPLAAHIVFGPAADPGRITLRVRVEQYTTLHAVAEAADGRLIATARFIKATGGCSAPAAETPDVALRGAGRMKLLLTAGEGGEQAELLIRHPNFNGMQMDQVTRLYTPARYLNAVDVTYLGQRVLHMDADISLSSDPAIGFGLRGDGTGTVSVRASDSAGAVWQQDFQVRPHGG
jgi:sulfur-oxidizing protein SoxY